MNRLKLFRDDSRSCRLPERSEGLCRAERGVHSLWGSRCARIGPSLRSGRRPWFASRFQPAGFTIVELMVSLFIFGMLAAAGTTLLAFSVRSQAAAAIRLEAVADDARLASLLASDLAQAVPRRARDSAGATLAAFRGSNGVGAAPVLHYVRSGWSNAEDAPRASLQRVEIAVVEGRLERRSFTMIDGTDAGLSVVLADGVEGVRLRYRDKAVWRSDWSDPNPAALPRAVELIVRRAGQPPLMMAFLVGVGA
ncbi:MAG: type II secretion system minor pseudopilin GspJ [Sphingomonadaceae bacterium]